MNLYEVDCWATLSNGNRCSERLYVIADSFSDAEKKVNKYGIEPESMEIHGGVYADDILYHGHRRELLEIFSKVN